MNYETRRKENQATALQRIRNLASNLERSGRVSRLLETLIADSLYIYVYVLYVCIHWWSLIFWSGFRPCAFFHEQGWR